ncbi:MAG: PD-(D/E)XK nuclease-like domain-containing protein [Planctomycetes bacterium]|nr:PD-(D/E)XK nuclease-like domain-containing protein [Planctomycetota bacterium]
MTDLAQWTSCRSPISEILIREPEAVYQAMRAEYLSSHALADFRANPWLYRKKQLGLVTDEDRPAYVIGRAAHTLILEGRDAFERSYAIGGGPVNPKTGEVFGTRTKAYQEWADAQGKPVLSHDQASLVERLALAIHEHAHARDLLTDGIPEGVVRAEYGGVPSQIRIDWFNNQRGIVDLKTCDNLSWLEADARTYGYAHQMAFYRAVLSRACGVNLPVHLIAVEKREPYRVGVWSVSDQVLALTERENLQAITRLRNCRASDTWPTGYEEPRVFDFI